MKNQEMRNGDSRFHIIKSPVHQDSFLDTIRTKLVVSTARRAGEGIAFSSEVKCLDDIKTLMPSINVWNGSAGILPPGLIIENAREMSVKASDRGSHVLLPTFDDPKRDLFSLTSICQFKPESGIEGKKFFKSEQRDSLLRKEKLDEEILEPSIISTSSSPAKVFRILYKTSLLFEQERVTRFLSNLEEVTFYLEEIESSM